ncbi:flippase-like domain-containing protein [Paenibacillus sp. ACRRX]|uniref:flippase-like domain-containing protein n=1 Tax=Paenibacillus sp. ACRRX TaxID=2918206 RepID=UPI001EF4F3F8|nr:flippase-like domain-containing protein [Paenibacillus sp. ACRRX]MCG7409350.1 flippase-like domain-containing protein [Paenibacillus sp. ACRRX]
MNAIKSKLQALFRQRWLVKSFKIGFPLAVILFVIIQGKKELSRFSISESLKAVRLLSSENFTGLIILGILAVSTMFFYDVMLLRSIRAKMRWSKIFRVSWIANTFNGIFGFGGVAGVGVRTVLYRSVSKDASRLLLAIAWMAPSMISGLSLLSILVIIGVFPAHELLNAKGWLWIVLIGIALFFPTYLLLSRWKGRQHANVGLTFGYTLVSFIEWLAAGTVAYSILVCLGVPVSYIQVIGIYTVSAVAGIISMVPGGFGTFDITYLIGMQALGVEDHLVFTGLLLFRIIYYFIPFGLGLIFAAFEFGEVAVKKWEDHPKFSSYIESGSIFWFIQRSVWMSLSAWSITILLFMTSIFLLAYGVTTPELGQSFVRIPWLNSQSAYPIVNGMIIGSAFLILMMLKGIFERTLRAYYITLIALLISTTATFLLGTSIRHTLWLLGMLLFVFLLRSQFTRLRYPITKAATIVSTLFMLIVVWMYLIIGKVFSSLHDSIEFGSYLLSQGEWATSIVTAGIVFVCLYSIGWAAFEHHNREPFGREWSYHDRHYFQTVPNGWIYEHVPYKRMYETDIPNMQLPIVIRGRRVLVLGLPQIDAKYRAKVMQQLYAQADRFGYEVVFTQVNSEWMPLLHDYGNDFFKIGERAHIRMEGTITEEVPDMSHVERYDFPLDQSVQNHLLASISQWSNVSAEYVQGFTRALHLMNGSHYLFVLQPASHETWTGYAIVFLDTANRRLIIEDMRCTSLSQQYEPSEVTDGDHHLLHTLYMWARHKEVILETGFIPLAHVETSLAPYSWTERSAIAMYRRLRGQFLLYNQRYRWQTWSEPEWESQYVAFPKRMSLNTLMWRYTRWLQRIHRQSLLEIGRTNTK